MLQLQICSSESNASVSVYSNEICLLSSSADENVFEGCYNKEPEHTKEELKRMENNQKKSTKYIFFAVIIWTTVF